MTAVFLEAFIYDYCVRRKSANYVNKYLEKMDTISKFVIGTRLFATKGIPEDSHILEQMRQLFRLRNNLVHHKTKNSKSPTFSIPPEFEPIQCIKFLRDLCASMELIDPGDQFVDMIKYHINGWLSQLHRRPHVYPLIGG